MNSTHFDITQDERKKESNTMSTTNWDASAIVNRRDRFYAPSQKAFVPYDEPMIFKSSQGQYLWDEQGNKYIDLLGINVYMDVAVL